MKNILITILLVVLCLGIFANLIDNGGFSNFFEESTSDVESSEPKGVTFNIDVQVGKDSYFTRTGSVAEGTTWASWCANENVKETAAGYPNGDLWVNKDGYVYLSENEFYLADSNNNKVLWSSEIVAGTYGKYNSSSEDVIFNISIQTGEDDFYTAGGTVSKGTTWGVWCDEYDSDPDRLAAIGESWQAIDGYVYNAFIGKFIADANNNKVLWSSEIVAGTYVGYDS